MERIIVIGGGLVGLGTALALQRRGLAAEVVVLEKERDVAQHQSSHNSGVLHCGLYYQPGSLKAKLAVDGIRSMITFCREQGIPHEVCGKIVLAVDDSEVERLRELERRGMANGLSGLRWLTPEEIEEREPHARGRAALLVPEEGIVDYFAVAQRMRSLLIENGGSVVTAARVTGIAKNGVQQVVETTCGEHRADFLVNCGGLHCDRIAEMAGLRPSCRIVPFRGEYFKLSEKGQRLVKHLIYPVPDPRFPFLGVHFTRMIAGGVEAGPNAVLATKREGYTKLDFSIRDVLDYATFSGFYKFLLRYPKAAVSELLNSFSKSIFLSNLQWLVPGIQMDDLSDEGGSGVRAQALDYEGRPVLDFLFEEAPGQLHVLNAPSPGATASLAIGEYLAAKVAAMV
ncbi:hydroxyglutarate oxidase [Verrucomicrobiaceae bacterium SCGC AG-212-N21]|nr:hydroxyglutarate oxidase [Verrucomicrobiaceae bacterium SCGC AG-212-N21]